MKMKEKVAYLPGSLIDSQKTQRTQMLGTN